MPYSPALVYRRHYRNIRAATIGASSSPSLVAQHISASHSLPGQVPSFSSVHLTCSWILRRPIIPETSTLALFVLLQRSIVSSRTSRLEIEAVIFDQPT